MAFHGTRGSSRGRGPSSGGARGRGGGSLRGRGGARGGSRGGARGGAGSRGRGGFRGGRGKPIFDSQRLAQQEAKYEPQFLFGNISNIVRNESGSDSESGSPSEEEPVSEDESSDGDDEPLPAMRSYATLMQSFASESAPQAKRRKLDLASEPVEQVQEVLSETNEEPDHVDHAEEEPEVAVDEAFEDGEDDDDASGDTSDPFEVHFAAPDDNILARRLKALELNQLTIQKITLPKLGRALFSVPDEDSKITNPPTISASSELKLKQKLVNVMAEVRPNFDALEQHIAPLMFNHQDLLYCERSTANSKSLRRLACLHAVNHVFKYVIFSN